MSFVTRFVVGEIEFENMLSEKDLLEHIVVVSIVGEYRKGKSFFLNFVKRYLLNQISDTKMESHINVLTRAEYDGIFSDKCIRNIFSKLQVLHNEATIFLVTEATNIVTNEREDEQNEKLSHVLLNPLQENGNNKAWDIKLIEENSSTKALLQLITNVNQNKQIQLMTNNCIDIPRVIYFITQEYDTKCLFLICIKDFKIYVHEKLKLFKFHETETANFLYEKLYINNNKILIYKKMNFSFEKMIKILLDTIYESNKITLKIKKEIKNYKFEIIRLFSFLEQKNENRNMLKMTSNGLYMSKTSINCAFCKLEIKLDSYDSDEILKLHHELSPDCIMFTDMKNGNVEVAKTFDFSLELHRLLSFTMTTWTSHVSKNELAKHGFRWSGQKNDATRCSFCTLEIQGWLPGDNVYSEHLKFSPQCPLFSGMANGINNWQCKQDLLNKYLKPEEFENKLHQVLESYPEQKEEIIDLLLNRDSSSNKVLLFNSRNPEFTTLEARLATYSTWPICLKQTPQELSEAGFFYTGVGDRVICFHCNGGLKDWGSDDHPWLEHATWFSHCQYLIQQKGRDFVETVQTFLSENMVSELSRLLPALHVTSNKIVRQLKEIPTINASNISQFESKEIASDMKELKQCYQCQTEDKNCVLLPCAHLSTCVNCAQQLVTQKDLCPICNNSCLAFVKVFLA